MTIAADATAASTTATGATSSPVSFNITLGASATFLVVMTQAEDDLTRTVTGVTCGGVAMTKHASSPNDGGETPGGRQYLWYLASPGTGVKSIVVTMSGTTTGGFNCRAFAVTGTQPEIIAAGVTNSSGTNPKQNVVTGGRDSLVVGMLQSGQDTAAAVSVDANTTAFGGVIDVGATQHAFARKTANTTGTDGPGWTVASEDYLLYAVAIAEAITNQAVTPAKPTITITPGSLGAFKQNIPTLTKPTVTITAGTPTVSLAGLPEPAEIVITPGELGVVGAPVELEPGGPVITITPGTPFITPFTPITAGTATITITPGTGLVTLDTGIREIAPDGATITVTPKTITIPPPTWNVVPTKGTITITPSHLRVFDPALEDSGGRSAHGRGARGNRGHRGRWRR